MLKNLGDEIKYCYERALDSALRALETADPSLKAHHEAMEQDWLRLADSYELSQRLERYLLEQDTKIDSRGEWRPVASAPFDRYIELAVTETAAPHALAFPCRRILRGWLNAETGERIEVHPTRWREWTCPSSEFSGQPGVLNPAHHQDFLDSEADWTKRGSGSSG